MVGWLMRFELLVAPKRFDGYMVKMALKLEEKLLELIVKCWDSNGWDLPNQESWMLEATLSYQSCHI